MTVQVTGRPLISSESTQAGSNGDRWMWPGRRGSCLKSLPTTHCPLSPGSKRQDQVSGIGRGCGQPSASVQYGRQRVAHCLPKLPRRADSSTTGQKQGRPAGSQGGRPPLQFYLLWLPKGSEDTLGYSEHSRVTFRMRVPSLTPGVALRWCYRCDSCSPLAENKHQEGGRLLGEGEG